MITVVNGMYTSLEALYNGPMERLTDLASDDGWTWRNELECDLFIASPTFVHTQTTWANSYVGISGANTVLSNADNVVDFSSDLMKRSSKGQARFMRAFHYFNLVRLFGGVPLIVNQVSRGVMPKQPRASIQDVYAQIAIDLDSAIALLPAVYDGSFGMEKGRPTTYSASALKAIVNLELEKWDVAAAAAADVISSNNFSLPANYAANFNGSAENGAGSLFQVQYAGSNPTTSSMISAFYAPTDYQGLALILPTDDSLKGGGGGPSSGNSFVQSFETGDLRRPVILSTYGLANFVNVTKPAGTLFFVNKFYNSSEVSGRSSWNFPLIRYAGILLARAEALNEISYSADGEAFNLLNQVRSKAGLVTLTSVDLPNQSAFRQALRNERRIELSFEAIRYFDLNRWGILQASVQPQLNYVNITFPSQKTIKHPITGKQYYLYPLPATEFINNAKLGSQNPGY